MNKNKLKTPGNPLTISFDFSTSEQKILFQWLSDHDYKLYLYKASNVVAGVGLVPIWYSIPFTELAAGKIVISHVPTYRAYMAYTVASDVGDEIKVFTISDDVLLGTQLTLDKYGEFYETGKAPSITPGAVVSSCIDPVLKPSCPAKINIFSLGSNITEF
jgi:hypothetical protein